MSKIYQGDVGTVVEAAVCDENGDAVDLSGATTTDIKVKKPDGTTTTWTGAVNGSISNQIDYTTVSGDLDQAGRYKVQAYVVTPLWSGLGETAKFTVYEAYS